MTETLVQESVTDDENIEELVEAVEAVEETSVTNTLYSFMTSVFEMSLFFIILVI
ncbi:MAG: hypothetical protein Q4F54_04605 [Coriobacteriia bacterium]|nr:hypothetical protein [Coriobacteriia bacterium]